jgi:hypothetical protein
MRSTPYKVFQPLISLVTRTYKLATQKYPDMGEKAVRSQRLAISSWPLAPAPCPLTMVLLPLAFFSNYTSWRDSAEGGKWKI